MLTKRLIVCLDVRNRKVTKGVKFKGNIDIGDPVEMGARYSDDGVDELVFYDITASAENRPCLSSGLVLSFLIRRPRRESAAFHRCVEERRT